MKKMIKLKKKKSIILNFFNIKNIKNKLKS